MLPIDWDRLRSAATRATDAAYAPYSLLRVGAAALVDDGRVVTGCNVENASYGLSLCAECGLVSALHATGGGRLVAVVCIGRPDRAAGAAGAAPGAGARPGEARVLTPCGRCRQLLYEHGGPGLLVAAPGALDAAPVTLAALLPGAFGAADLPPARAAGGETP